MTTKHSLAVLITAALLAFATPAFTQDTSGDGTVLPDICKSADTVDMKPKMKMDQWPMDPAHQDLMAGMDQMNSNMNQGV